MKNYDGKTTKNLTLYPPAKPSEDLESPLWAEFDPEESGVQSILTLGKALYFKDETKDDIASSFISNPPLVNQPTN
jgi:hypothetical protein